MAYIVFAYMIIALFTGVPAVFRGDVMLGLSGTLGPILAMIAGGGITQQKTDHGRVSISVVAFSLILFALSAYWTYRTGWTLRFWSVSVPGPLFGAVGYGLGLLFGRTKDD